MRILLATLCLVAALCLPAFAGDAEREAAGYLSDEGVVVFLFAGIGLPLLEGGADGEQQGYRALDALIATAIASEALKRAVAEERPDGSGEKDSFPSLHSAAAFSVAAVQAERHPDEAWLWYSGASLIAASRVPLKRHRVRDVLAGALLGYGIAQWELSEPNGLVLQPLIQDDGGMGLYISTSF